MNSLIIDTATSLQIVIYLYNGKVYENVTRAGNTHTETLVTSIEHVIQMSGGSSDEIDCIISGLGPGSFTGVRIAVVTARMFSQVLNVPVVGISTHELLSSSFDDGEVILAFDAKKSRVFGSIYSIKNNVLTSVVDPDDYYLNEILQSTDVSKKYNMYGDGIFKYLGDVQSHLPLSVYHSESIEEMCNDKTVCFKLNSVALAQYAQTVAINEINSGKYKSIPDYYNSLLPLYKRKSDAEVAKDALLQK